MMHDVVRIAIAGAGLIGHRHAAAVSVVDTTRLSAVVDPGAAGPDVARRHDAAHYESLDRLFDAEVPQGVILATPNQLHVPMALACIERGIPVLVEKPLADDVAGARRIVDASLAAGVPVLVGHHRRHNPLIARARALIDEGRLGRITAVHSSTWLFKPDDYFEASWRRKLGAGPVSINLIHDIDVLRYLCGEIETVQAMTSNAVRGFETEDTAAVILRFSNGALGTLGLSDTVVSACSWELTAGENPMYPSTDNSCYQIGGTHGSLSLPNLALWSQPEGRSWWKPISETRVPLDNEDPLTRQVRHFADVIRGTAQPLITAADGLANQRVIEAISKSASTSQSISLA